MAEMWKIALPDWLKTLLARLFPFARVGGWQRHGDFGEGSSGVRAPLIPRDPVLVGTAALEIPRDEEWR
jgi:hypothetical protein